MGIFSIVEFEDGIQLAPTSWIYCDNKKCYWPSYTKQAKINQAIFNQEDPNPLIWPSYNILRIFGTTDTHANGIKKLKIAEQFSDIDSGKNDIEKKISRRERAKKRNYYTSDSENESCHKQKKTCKEIPPLPILQIAKEQSNTISSVPENILKQKCNNELQENSTFMASSSLYDFKKHGSKISSDNIESDILCSKQQSLSYNTDFQKEILRKLNIILYKINTIDKRMEILEERRLISYYKREGDINTLNTKELGLPLCDELALNTLENKLEDNEFFESIVHTLKGLGGVDVHSCTINILKKLMSNSLAEMYSFAGMKKKKAFQELTLYKIILKTVRIHYKDVTEEEVAKFIAKWLVQARDPQGRDQTIE
ncbi:uncharacterized protein [Linepithema humile]|uniref:uncharacterized protein n=1 Tax=Linepithema humile TaxID=83485 RepID=UPI00351F6C2B